MRYGRGLHEIEKPIEIAAAVDDAEKTKSLFGYAIEDQVIPGGEAAKSPSIQVISGSAHKWISGNEQNSFLYGINKFSCDLNTCAFLCNVHPDCIQIRFKFRRSCIVHVNYLPVSECNRAMPLAIIRSVISRMDASVTSMPWPSSMERSASSSNAMRWARSASSSGGRGRRG